MADYTFNVNTDADSFTSYGQAATISSRKFQVPQATNPLAVKATAPLPARAVSSSKAPKNPFLLDPVQIQKRNPFLIPLLPNPDLFGINIPT